MKLILDMGSNAIKGALFDERSGEILHEWREVTELGRGFLPDGTLSEAAVRRTLTSAADIRKKAEKWASCPVEVHAIGTEALRKSRNVGAIVAQFEAMFGARLDVISGAEEARLERVAVMHSAVVLAHDERPLLHLDMGGSSTECSIIDAAGEAAFSGSFAFGRHRLVASHPERPAEFVEFLAILASQVARFCPKYAVLAGSSIVAYVKSTGDMASAIRPHGAVAASDLGAMAGSILVNAVSEIAEIPMFATHCGVRHGWIMDHLER